MVQKRAGVGNTVGVMVRMPEGLRNRIKDEADKSGRSMNSEIVEALEQHFPSIADDIETAYQKMVSGLNSLEASEEEGSTGKVFIEALRLAVEGIMFELRREKDAQRRMAYVNSLLQLSVSISLALQSSKGLAAEGKHFDISPSALNVRGKQTLYAGQTTGRATRRSQKAASKAKPPHRPRDIQTDD